MELQSVTYGGSHWAIKKGEIKMSQKYVVISSDGINSFYDDGFNTIIPSGALEISDADYNTFFSDNGKYIFTNINGVATISALTTVYFATDYGLTITTGKSNTSTPVGAIRFNSSPTTAELEAAFPTTPGSKTFTVSSVGTVGDTVALGGVTINCAATLVLGSAYTVGTDAPGTAANIVACLNANSSFVAVYKATAANAVITITEIMKGNGDDPQDAVCTGGITLTTGTVVKSVWGYTTAILNQKISAINAVYNAEMLQIIRADDLAKLKGTATSDHTAALTSLSTWLDTEQEAAINEQ
jgi:hypothetical protein